MTAAESDGLVFITYTAGGRAHDSQTRRKVRKRAWNAWWNKESNRRLNSRSPRSLKQSQGRFRLRHDDPPGHTPPNVKQYLSISPSIFQAVVEASGDRAWTLLNYYFRRFSQNSSAVNVEGDWIAFTFSNEASRHAQLALVALNAELESGLKVQVQTMKHTDAAIKLVRNKLRDMSEMPDDALVGAVALLVVIESMQADRASSAVHYHGLSQMVSVRGGFGAFAGMKSLQRVIAWARRIYWLRWQISSAPPWTPSLSPIDFETRVDARPTKRRLSSDIDRFSRIVSDELLQILSDFRHIATLPPPEERDKADRQLISQLIYDVEHKVIRLHQIEAANTVDPRISGNELSTLVKAACQLYIFIILRQMLGRSHIVQSYARALESHVEEYLQGGGAHGEIADNERDLLIWAMSLLLWTTYDDERQTALAKALAPLLESAEIVNLDQLVLTLKRVAWMDNMLHENLGSVWIKQGLLKP